MRMFLEIIYETIIVYYFNKTSKVISKTDKFVEVNKFLENEIHE